MNWMPPRGNQVSQRFNPVMTDAKSVRFLPSSKNTVTGVMLPLPDWELLAQPGITVDSPEFRKSWVPLRSQDPNDKDEKGHRTVIAPCAYLPVHQRMGPNGDDFVSPEAYASLFDPTGETHDTADPIADMMKIAKDKSSPYHWMTEDGSAGGGSKFALLSYASVRAIYAVLAVSAKEPGAQPKLGFMFLSRASEFDLMALVNIGRMASNVPSPRDPDNPDYLYGDVCNPNRPLVFHTMTKSSPTNVGQRFEGFRFSNNEVTLEGAQEAGAITEEVLKARPIVHDSRHYNISTYEEIVQRMVQENWFRGAEDLIRQACGNRVQIGGTQTGGVPDALPPGAASGQPQGAAAQGVAAQGTAPAALQGAASGLAQTGGPPQLGGAPQFGAPAAPPAGGAPPQFGAPTPPAPPAQETRQFWVVSSPGQPAELLAEAALRELVTAGGTGAAVMDKEQTSGWKTAADFGIVPDEIPMDPPAPPAQPAPPAPPSPPASPPAQPAPPADDVPPFARSGPRSEAPAATGEVDPAFAGKSLNELVEMQAGIINRLSDPVNPPTDQETALLAPLGERINVLRNGGV